MDFSEQEIKVIHKALTTYMIWLENRGILYDKRLGEILTKLERELLQN
jgi:hypothetical protein